MDVRSWKKVLLNWVIECGFIEGNYFSLEQIDIDEFFRRFRANHRVVFKSDTICTVKDFLKEHYADYAVSLDDETSLNSVEYIYIYSLLLHFSCVKYPETQFHEICKRLSANQQKYIAAFFNEMLEYQTIDRDKLRQAIAGIVMKHSVSPVSGNDSNPSGNSSSVTNFIFPSTSVGDSPIRAVCYAPGSSTQGIVPPTPKSAMLEERTRELYNLRAQLETERYEKGLLEVQIKQNEEKMIKLNHDHRKLHQTIQDLKNDILRQNAETSSPTRNDDDQMQRRLCKEMSQRELEISNLNELLSNLKEDKSMLQEKLHFADQQMGVCMDRIRELDIKVDELSSDLEQKEHTIKYLTETKLELEQYINEARSAANTVHPQYLDASFSPNTDTSGSTNSPENLGISVVDVQLREKEHENTELREELQLLKNHNCRISERMKNFTLQHAEEHNITTSTAKEESNVDIMPSDYLDHLIDYVDRLGLLYRDEKNRVKNLQVEIQVKIKRNDELSRRLADLERDINTIKEQVKNMEHTNSELEHSRKRAQEKTARCEQELVKISEQKFELASKMESLANDYDTHKHKCALQRQEYIMQIKKLKDEISIREQDNVAVTNTNQTLTAEMISLQSKIKMLEQNMHRSSDEIRTLTDRIKGYQNEVDARDKTEKLLKEKYEKVLVQHESTKRDRRETADHLEAMRNKIAVKELEMSKLGSEIVEVRKKNVELETRIDVLTTEFKAEKNNCNLAISSRDEQIRKIREEREELEQSLQKMKSEHERKMIELKESKDDLSTALLTFNALNILLCSDKHDDTTTDLTQRLGNVVTSVKHLQEEKLDLETRLELLTSTHTDTIQKMKVMEEDMNSQILNNKELENVYKSQLEQVAEKLQISEEQLKIYEEDIENMNIKLQQTSEDMQNSIQINSEEHAVRIMELSIEHDRVVSSLQEEIKSTKEELLIKDSDLQVLLEESGEVKRKVDESVQRLEAVQGEHTQMRAIATKKLKSLEEQMGVLISKNKRLVDEIDTLKAARTEVNNQLEEANNALDELNGTLMREVNCKSELSLKLETSESRLLETEEKIENILKEKSDAISGLKTAYENQAAVIKRSECQINTLEKMKQKQIQVIATLQQNLRKVTEEKDRLTKDATAYTSQIQREQEEKSTLLASLEQTADQLKVAICEKDHQSKILEKSCADLTDQVKNANELHAKLQTDLLEKEAQLQRLLEQQEHERGNWQKKLSEMMSILAENSVELEQIDATLMHMTNVIESNINIISEVEKLEFDEFFKIPENNKDTQLDKLMCALNRLLHSNCHLHNQLDKTEQKRQGAVEVLEKANDKVNSQLLDAKAEITELQQQLLCERKQSSIVEHLKQNVNDLQKLKTKSESQIVQLEHECAALREQQNISKGLVERLEQEKQELKSELHRANENVTRLIQGGDALRLEKDCLVEELQQLRQQLMQTIEQHSLTESMVKNVLQNSTSFGGKLDSTENELKNLRVQLQMLETKKEDVTADNCKLREALDANKKRVEKMAVKLGDTQARCSKFEHENDKLNETLAASKAAVEKLEREKATLVNEKQSLQERLSNSERNQQQLFNKVHQIEQAKVALEAEKKQLETSEANAKLKLTKLEKIRQTNEEKIRKLNYSLEAAEANNVRLNHEIGAINSQLNELKQSISADNTAEQLEEAVQQRDKALARANEFETLANKLQTDVCHLKEQNSTINDRLSKVSLSLQISQEKCEMLAEQFRDLEMEMAALREKKAVLENEYMHNCAKLKEYEMQNVHFLSEQRDKVVTFEAQLEKLEKDLCTKSEEIAFMQAERETMRSGRDEEKREIDQLRQRLSVAEALMETEQKTSTQLRLDNQILQAKYHESKQRLQDEVQASEERIKENRLEMEGKLDKMKNKMKTLYTEEVAKMKGKQERELSAIQADMDMLKAKNAKYEEHTRKLSNQIVRLNDLNLEHQKQNALLCTKVKHLQDQEHGQFKRPSLAMHANSLPRTLSAASSNAAMGSNLTMEDEEGEVFNNTYLTDLQTGRMSMCRDVCAEELQYRNSLLPPHLKSTYTAQYDHGLPDDELKVSTSSASTQPTQATTPSEVETTVITSKQVSHHNISRVFHCSKTKSK